MNIIDNISKDFKEFLLQQFAEKDLVSNDLLSKIDFQVNADPAKTDFGDINSNCAMVLAKELGKSPREIATQIIETFKNRHVEKIELAGPGFLNVFLTEKAYRDLCGDILNKKHDFFKQENATHKNYNIEFVSVNPTGPIHFGHGRGAIIGDVLANVLKFLGNKTTKEYYINDAGAQVTKLGMSFKIRCMQELGDKEIQLPQDAYHGEYLVDLAKQAVKEFGSEILEKECSFFEQYAKDKMLELIRKTVDDYGVTFDVWFSEKSLHNSGAIKKSLNILEKKGHLFEQEGALWFKSTSFGDDKDRVVVKSDGQPTYLAPDIAYLENKAQRGFDHLVMMLGHDHHSYETRLEGIRKALGLEAKLTVILFQLVKMKASGELVRMSKRAGNIVTLDDIIELVGKDVARFFYLNRKADAQLEFDLDLASKKTDENPVYYIQYAYVRTKSILEKAAANPDLLNITEHDSKNLGKPEHFLIKKIFALRELLQNIAKNFQTHLLAYYTLELATAFHSYYSKNRVLDEENISQSRARLLMVTQVRETLELCLDLLGISKPQRM